MKHKTWFVLSTLVLIFACAGASLSALPHPDYDLARYPGSTRLGGGRLDLTSLHKGMISQYGAYRTSDDSVTVWRWYAGRFDVVPLEGGIAMGNCLSLGKDDRQALTGRMIAVTLCTDSPGTLSFVNWTVFLWPNPFGDVTRPRRESLGFLNR